METQLRLPLIFSWYSFLHISSSGLCYGCLSEGATVSLLMNTNVESAESLGMPAFVAACLLAWF